MKNTHRLPYIDAWRFFAIFLVILSHVIEYSHPIYQKVLPGLIWRVHPMGTLGVHIFFCISGYVICRGMVKEVAIHGAVSMRYFYLRRVLRIVPPLMLYLLFLAVLAQTGSITMSAPQFAQSAAFLCNISLLGNCGWYAGHTWSLAFEEQFYMIFPMLFVGLGMARKRRTILPVIGVLIAFVLSAQLAAQPHLALYFSIFAFMLWGCVYALYEDVLGPMVKKLPVALWCAGIALLIGVHLVALPWLWMNVVYPLVAPLIICAVVFGTPLARLSIRKLFGNPVLAYLGQISYTIYLWQQVATADHGFASPLVVFGLLGVVILLAHFSYQYLELPLIRMGRRQPVDQGLLGPDSVPIGTVVVPVAPVSPD